MTLTDREKALVEAVRKLRADTGEDDTFEAIEEIDAALRAYDPPKPKVYTMPSWDEFVAKVVSVDGDFIGGGMPAQYVRNGELHIYENEYNAIRELTAKDSE